ncbi:MAG: CARDB domain-containing protein [Promethearchaeota archaeon]
MTVPSIVPGDNRTASWTGAFPSTIPNGTYYVGWIIDGEDYLIESNESNNIDYLNYYS